MRIQSPEEAASSQGVRKTMEDAHICCRDLPVSADACVTRDEDNSDTFTVKQTFKSQLFNAVASTPSFFFG